MKDYREYIESWVHEIKLPITALELMVQKEEPKKKNRLMEELERIDNYVEQVLLCQVRAGISGFCDFRNRYNRSDL